MKIGIMAPQESGKTSYLVGLFGTLMRFNTKLPNDYGLKYEWINKEQKGLLDSQFKRLLQKDIGSDRFPKKTLDLNRHQVRVRHKEDGGSKEIELIDFPGELLRGDQGSKIKAANIEKALTECDGFIVLLDARYLNMSEFEATQELATADIDLVLEKTIEKRVHGSIGVPVALCISKYDCLTPDQKGEAYKKIKELFPRFFESNHDHPFFMTGISLGTKIDDGEAFAPLHLENPLEFCLAMCAFIERDSENEQAIYSRRRQDEEEGKIEEIEEEIRKRKNTSISEIVNEQLENVKKIGKTNPTFIPVAGIVGTFRIAERLWPSLTANSHREQIDSHQETADRHERRKEEHQSKVSESIRIGEEAAKQIRDVDNSGIIYYKGKEHHFKRKISMGFPLEEYIAL